MFEWLRRLGRKKNAQNPAPAPAVSETAEAAESAVKAAAETAEAAADAAAEAAADAVSTAEGASITAQDVAEAVEAVEAMEESAAETLTEEAAAAPAEEPVDESAEEAAAAPETAAEEPAEETAAAVEEAVEAAETADEAVSEAVEAETERLAAAEEEAEAEAPAPESPAEEPAEVAAAAAETAGEAAGAVEEAVEAAQTPARPLWTEPEIEAVPEELGEDELWPEEEEDVVGPEPEEDETPKVSKKERKARRKRLFVNRELSWLSFNERVLAEAGNPAVPLAERLMFVKIFQSNLDEFFRVRVGTLMTQMQSQEKIRDNKTGMTSKQQVRAILKRCRHLEGEKAVIYEQLMGELEPQGLRLIDFHRLSREESSLLERYFDAHIAPYLTPMLMSRQQPFPFLNNEDIYAVALLAGRGGKKRLGIVPCSGRVFKRLVEIPTRPGNYILTEEMILHFISKLYAGTQVKEKTLIRLTRNADIDSLEVYDEDLDYRDVMEQLIRRRSRLSPVRLEYTREMSPKVLDILAEKLGLDEEHLIKAETPLDLGFVGALQDALAGKSELFYPPRSPRLAAGIDPRRSMVDQVLEKDRLLSYPFETMRTFVKLLQDAANDDRVAKIQITLYRLADPSSVVDALVEAAENGKAVEALIELRARFDEANNIEMSRRLEEAGVHVIYGLEQYKVHSKLCLITLQENDTVSHITQVGTGNYNEKTSRQYTDLCLMTSDEEIGEEAASLFCALMMGETVEVTHSLLAAPHCLQVPLLEKIDAQMEIAKAGGDAYVGFKINSLTDKAILEKLIEASQAGVTIDMVVRGICCLKPGVPGETDNIRVISVVGRYLEHSRIYVFGRGDEAEVYISSADLMTRNTIRRVELAAPVRDPDCRAKVLHVFETVLSDNVKGRREMPDGSYEDIEITGEAINSQEKLYAEAYGETYVGPVPEQAEIEFPDEPEEPADAAPEFPEAAAEESAAAAAEEPEAFAEEIVTAAAEVSAEPAEEVTEAAAEAPAGAAEAAAAEIPAEAAEAPERAAEAVPDAGAEIPEEAQKMPSEAAEEPAEASAAEAAPQAADEAEKPAENGFGQ